MKVETTQPLSDLSSVTVSKPAPSESNQITTKTVKLDNATSQVDDDNNVNKKEEPATVLDRDQLESMAQKLQEFLGSLNRGLEFSVHEDSGRDVIKVIDKNTGDTVRQYPSEEVLDLVASLSDVAGTFVNVKA